MIQQTIFPFKIEMTKEKLTAHGGLALMAEFNHGIGLRELTDRYLPAPGSNRGFDPSVIVDTVVLMLQGGGRRIEDLRELRNEEGLMRLIGHDEIPEPDTVGDWLRRMGDREAGELGLRGLDRVRYKINERILKRDGVKYAITADQDKAVKGLIASIPDVEWKEPVRGCGYELAEAVHCMEKTKKAFRLVIKRGERRQGELFEKGGQYFYHAVAKNWLEEEKDSREVLEWHNQRGQAESFNKELKIGIGMERMPCGQTQANAVFFRIGVVAYNLFIGFKRLSCPESWMKQTLATFRWKMVQVAGRIVRHAGETVLKLMIDVEKLELFRGIRKKSFELTLCPDG